MEGLSLHLPPRFTPERTHAAGILLGRCLGLPLRCSVSQTATTYSLHLPSGARLSWPDALFTGLEERPAWHTHAPQPHEPPPGLQHDALQHELPVLYGQPVVQQHAQHTALAFDPIAATLFYILQLEAPQLPRDAHNRPQEALRYEIRHGLQRRPLVQEYATYLRYQLLRLGLPERTFTLPAPRLLPTHDVDQLRLWDRPLKRAARSLLKQLPAYRRLATTHRAEPYDSFAALLKLAEEAHTQPLFFLKAGPTPCRHDAPYNLRSPYARRVLLQLQQASAATGLHSSYHATQAKRLARALPKEHHRLATHLKAPLTAHRTHFLRTPPALYPELAALGYTEEHSLGYHSHWGFRAGLAVPFPLWNYEARAPLPLEAVPLLWMDSHLRARAGTPIGTLLLEVEALRSTLRRHGGTLSFNWHNAHVHPQPWQAYQPLLHALYRPL